jgi:hypothetical protein
LKRVKDYVSKDNMLVVFLEDIRKNPQVQFNNVLNFLGVSPLCLQKYSTVNRRQHIRSIFFRNFILSLSRFRKFIGITSTTGFLKPLNRLNQSQNNYQKMRIGFKRELDDYFYEEIMTVEKIVGRVPDEWFDNE